MGNKKYYHEKFACSLLVLTTVLAVNAKAQHSSTDEGRKHKPVVLFKREITSLPNVTGQEAQVVLVTLAPGEVASAHRHPQATIGYVLEGEIASTFEGKQYIYKQGDTFWEEPNGLHNQTKNTSNSKEAKLLVFFLRERNAFSCSGEKIIGSCMSESRRLLRGSLFKYLLKQPSLPMVKLSLPRR